MSDRPIVLHVVESLGGGVASAVEDYIRATPGFEHRMLARFRPDAHSLATLQSLSDGIIPMREGHLRRIRDVRRAWRDVRPSVVHAHSSFGGAYARLAGLPRDRVVYTPHCFAFERLDVPGPVRLGFRLMEQVLSFRGRWIAAVSDREASLAARLPGRPRVVMVPNVARVDGVTPSAQGGSEPLVVAVGRLQPQKDPVFLARAAREAASAGVPARWRWIGGGDEAMQRELEAAGVEVTGWVERDEALRQLAAADVYVHTAAWEGFPITVLEAAALGKPVLARRIPALEGSGLALVDDPAGLARDVGKLGLSRDDLLRRSAELNEHHRPEDQARALEDLYRRVLASSGPGTRG